VAAWPYGRAMISPRCEIAQRRHSGSTIVGALIFFFLSDVWPERDSPPGLKVRLA